MPLSTAPITQHIATAPDYKAFHAAYQEASALGRHSLTLGDNGVLQAGGNQRIARVVGKTAGQLGLATQVTRRNLRTFNVFRSAVVGALGEDGARDLEAYLDRRHIPLPTHGEPVTTAFLREVFVHLQPRYTASIDNANKLARHMPGNDGHEEVLSHTALKGRNDLPRLEAMRQQRLMQGAQALLKERRVRPEERISDSMAREVAAIALSRALDARAARTVHFQD